MKKITFLLSLLLASAGVTASAQDAFVASSAPSNGNWASDTKWYKMTLAGNHLSAYNTDHNGSLLDNSATAEGAGAYWCVVGDETNGYKFYNRAAGPNKVFGIVSAFTNDYNDVTRASFYTSETVSASSEVGTTFDLGLYSGTTSNEYHVKLHGAGNYYWNNRGKYLGYWNSSAATSVDGSKVKFSAVELSEVEAADNALAADFKTALSEKITAAKALLDDNKVGYYSQAAIDKAQAVLDATASTAADYYFAKIELKPNAPKAGVLYRIKSANSAFKTTTKVIYHDGATTKWGNEDVTNASQYWFIEPYGSFCYKLQAIDSKLYLNSASQLSTTPNYVEIASTPGLVNIRVLGAAMLHAAGHNGGQGNEGNVIAYEENAQIFGQEGGPSSWTIVEATLDEAKQMRVSGTPEVYEGGLLVGGFDAQNAEAFHQNMASSTTMEEVLNKINSELPIAGRALDVNKYYRLVCVSPKTGNKDANENLSDVTYTTLTRGTNNVVTAPFSKGNVDQIWKFEKTDGGYYLKNMNGNGYLNNVRQGDTRASLVNTPSDKFEIKEGTVSTQKALHVVGQIATACLFAENHPNEPAKGDPYAVCGWFQGSDYSNGAWAWKFVEADDIEVALNTVESKSYATAYLPFGVSAVSGAKAYTAAEPANGQTVMTETANFAKETGVLLVSDEAAAKAVLTIGDVDGATNTSALKGTLLAKDITGAQTKYLVFGKNKANETEVGFFEPSTTVTSIPANRAFFADAEGSAIALNFGNVTAVNNVVAGNANVNAPIFDLTGRRVVKAVKGGLYIQNGKKYIVK